LFTQWLGGLEKAHGRPVTIARIVVDLYDT
jgi:hypothetical protein